MGNKKEKSLSYAVMHNIYKFVIYMIASFVLTQVLVLGSSKIAVAVDNLFSGEEINLGKLMVPFLVLVLIGTVVSYVKSFAGSMFSVSVQTELKNLTTRRLVKLQFRYFDEKGAGSIMNRLVSDVFQIELLFSDTIPQLMVGLVTIITVAIYIFKLDLKLLFVTLVCYPVLLWLANVISKKVRQLAGNRRELYDELEETALDIFSGMIVGRSFNLYAMMKARIEKVVNAILKNEYVRTNAISLSQILGNIIRWIPRVICYLFALHEVYQGKISVGEMLAFAILLDRIVRPFGEIPSFINAMREQWVSFERLNEIMQQPEEHSGEGKFEADKEQPVIEFEHVKFGYDNDNIILNDINVAIKQGENIAFVGNSGGGKSTVFRILCGFYRHQEGTYRLYGHKYEEWDCREARKQFSLVSQNVFLFPDTIAANVALGKKDATQEEIRQACIDANINDFIEKLPDGYHTYVGERGVKLSGGQRQRISIARAFLNDAPILLLDEPTSAIDVGTEEMIQEALANVAKGKTVITIAHRLSTIRNSNRIFVFFNGKIAETGTHEELLQADGVYAELYVKESQCDDKGGADGEC